MALLPGVPATPTSDRILPAKPTFDEKFWVSVAEGAVRDFCLWHVAPIREEIFAVDGGGRSQILLPTMRLREVLSVVSGGYDVTKQVKASESGILELEGGFACGLSSVVVKISHGYDPAEVPSVQGVIASAASRFADSLGNIVQSQTAGGSTVTYFSGSESLLRSEQAKLSRYRLEGRS